MTHSFPGLSHLLARARLSSEKAVRASKESPGLANRLETEAQAGPCSLDDLRQICFFLWLSFPFGATRDWTRYCLAPSRHPENLPFSADPLLFLGSESHWSRPGSGFSGKWPPTCSSGPSGQKPSLASWSLGRGWEVCCCLWSQAVSKMSLLRENRHSSEG